MNLQVTVLESHVCVGYIVGAAQDSGFRASATPYQQFTNMTCIRICAYVSTNAGLGETFLDVRRISGKLHVVYLKI